MKILYKLIFGILVISWSSILIRWTGNVHPLIITFYRLLISAVLIFPFVAKQFPATLKKSAPHKYHLIAAAFFLTMHFYTWITSLQLTTVGNSIFLESTHPLFGWILSIIVLKEKASKALFPALILGLAGMYFTIAGNLFSGSIAFTGDLLALVSAFCIAAYLIVARTLRNEFELLPYLFLVYGIAAFLTLILLGFNQLKFWSVPVESWKFIFLLAIGPNLIGHSMLNFASRYIPVYKVNMALLSESVLATIYAGLLLNEIPEVRFYIGAVLIILAIGSVFFARK
jgi:drug/metabolite transporter (DMT)-like permease